MKRKKLLLCAGISALMVVTSVPSMAFAGEASGTAVEEAAEHAEAESGNVIRDPKLQAKINKMLKREENTPVSSEDMKQLTSLTIYSDDDVEDLEGLRYGENLTILNLTGEITGLEEIKDLNNLERLSVKSNPNLVSLSSVLGSKPELTLLDCSNSKNLADISALSHNVCPKLERVSLENCSEITEITSLKGYTSLKDLNLEKVNITEENRGEYQKTISSLTGLTRLSMPYCSVTDEDTHMFASLDSLETLILNINDITSTEFCDSLPASIRELSLYGNDISDMSNLARFTELTVLGMGDNQVTDFSFIGKLPDLTNQSLRHDEGSQSFPVVETYYYGTSSEPAVIEDGRVVLKNPYIGPDGSPISFDGAEVTSSDSENCQVDYDARTNEITLSNMEGDAVVSLNYNLPVGTDGSYKICRLRINVKAREEHQHVWGETSYTWSKDGSTCTARRVCGEDASHVEEETVTAEGRITAEATCTSMGETTYTAVFKNDWAQPQTLVKKNIDMIPHVSGEEWKADEASHWKECAACGTRLEESGHTFEWVIEREAAEGEPGSKYQECTVCGYRLPAVEIPAEPTPQPTEGPEKPEQKPTQAPTKAPTQVPTKAPTQKPSVSGQSVVNKSESPKTADTADFASWIFSGAGAALCLIAAAAAKKFKKTR